MEVFAKVADGFFSDIGGFEAFVPTALGLSPKIKIKKMFSNVSMIDFFFYKKKYKSIPILPNRGG